MGTWIRESDVSDMDAKQTELQLKQYIKQQMEINGGTLSFCEFMEICLYHPQLGYYQKHLQRIGKNGDFYTAPVVSDMFGEVIADYINEMWKTLKCPEDFFVIEYGAGTGKMAQALLRKLCQSELGNHIHYIIVEASGDFRDRQAECLRGYPVRWIQELGELADLEFACIVSNEFFDALPVHLVVNNKGMLMEKVVAYCEPKQQFYFSFQEADDELRGYFAEQSIVLREGQQAEVNLLAKKWVQDCAQQITNGYILTIDYGYTKEELYAPHHNDGTLLCYYRHTCNEDPLVRVGNQDITSHVNFSQLMFWGELMGWETVTYVPQSKFLIDGGILSYWDFDAPISPFDPQYKKNAAIKQLISEQGMGNSFQVLLQKKIHRA